ncbi:MAG: carboxypeptidase-like regulatory domain-containing protein [Blastocatellia bacterium]|nr:carboxypeptidase-like regulatory domain-containing protein [Blastocatellia bacterium]
MSRLLIFLLVLAAGASAQTEKGSISGRVVSGEGGGLAGITVQARPAGRRGGPPPRTASTDEEGGFVFENLRPGAYEITTMGGRTFVPAPVDPAERAMPRVYRLGESVTLTMIRGGVIDGRVLGPEGEPIVTMRVSAIRVRDERGVRLAAPVTVSWRLTDDRGAYRMYGLPPGAYIVKANDGNPFYNSQASLYDNDAPLYYPGSPRDTAAEIQVDSGSEATGIDIRFRSQRGHTLSGRLLGGGEDGRGGATVALRHAVTGALLADRYAGAVGDRHAFDFFGVPDGEYELQATTGWDAEEPKASPPRRVTVRGADVENIELRIAPLASVAGRLVVEAAPAACDKPGTLRFEEAVLAVRPDERVKSEFDSAAPPASLATTANEKGEFLLRGLQPRRYWLRLELPGESWYLKSFTAGKSDLARLGLTPKPGEALRDVTLTLAAGAAGLRGKLAARPSGRRRLHLVPVDPAADPLRYAETIVREDGAFELKHLAPGPYWLLARPIPDDESPDRPPAPLALDPAARAALRRDAEAKKIEVNLKLCGREVRGIGSDE